ncbi:MAG TPA: hypothetical protein VLX59_12970 [Acidimicrobiales bacterium]|nr:hypothetical protein [Acidimicrobiales bacterium]
MAVEVPELLVPNVNEWRSWLADHHGSEAGVRLVVAKKGFTEPTSVTYAAALEEALCYGWIDGIIGRRDERTYYQRFSPRRPKSSWTSGNVELAERLIAEGRMQAAGAAAYQRGLGQKAVK